jgi:hypothetical protein
MATVDDFSRLVSDIYTAALTPGHWGVALADVRSTLDGTSGALVVADGAGRSIMSASLNPDAAKTYTEHYCRLDHVLAAVEKGPVGALRSGTELIAPHVHSEFHADWVRPYDIEDGLFVRLTGGPMPTCFIVAAPKRSERFDTAERLTLMRHLVPHLRALST